MEKNRICRICNRRFANGKAMGGHMRSHLAKLPLPPKPIIIPEDPPSKSPSSSSSLNYPCVDQYQNRMQSYRSVNHDLPFMSKSNLAIEHEEEEEGEEDEEISETDESRRNPTRRRSKRRRKSSESVVKVAAESESPEQVSSSISDIFNEEDVALCLLMLSRDKQRRKMKQVVYENDYYIEDEQVEVSADAEEDEDESFGVIRVRSKSQGRYRCETCNKGFRSYQALGGHRASHKKIKTTTTHMRDDEYMEGSSGTAVGGGVSIEHRIFKCPFCDKVFESGQALGGHKKVHFSYLGNNANANYSNNAKFKSRDKLLDLNLPAPEDDGEVSQADISNLSNTKPYHLRN